MSELYHTHPILPCGLNADAVNGDEMDGAGTNWKVSPVLFDTAIVLKPLILTEEMFAAFNECPDLVVPCENDTIVIAPEADVHKIRRRA